MSGTCTAVVGLQWGDEAKGKIVDLLAEEHDVVVRYNGGANAGHTVVHADRTFKLSLLPTGVLRPGVQAIVGNGVVVHPARFLDEATELRQAGIEVGTNLVVSDRAHVIFPYHLEEEALREKASDRPIGTTQRGIGPCYQDKVGRQYGIRIGELLDEDHLRRRLRSIVPWKNRYLKAISSDARQFDADQIAEEYLDYGNRLRSHVADTTALLIDAYRAGKRILYEAAQGTLLDVDHGTFPYVTSSNSSAAGIWSGSGLPTRRLERVVGVIKAYTTRVGGGPFPTELDDEVGERIRRTGKEYGTVTGRPRRCGWFDAVATRYAAEVSGVDQLAVMLLDVLSEFDQLAICTAYELDGRRIDRLPSQDWRLSRCRPVYETMPGWNCDISSARSPQDLPRAAKDYLDRIAELLRVPIAIVSVGPDRKQTIWTPT